MEDPGERTGHVEGIDELVIPMMDVKEFRDKGYLHELNRRFLHPLGLALYVAVNEVTGEHTLGGIWDCRDDPEGLVFGYLNQEKMKVIDDLWQARAVERENRLGFVVQDRDVPPVSEEG